MCSGLACFDGDDQSATLQVWDGQIGTEVACRLIDYLSGLSSSLRVGSMVTPATESMLREGLDEHRDLFKPTEPKHALVPWLTFRVKSTYPARRDGRRPWGRTRPGQCGPRSQLG
jgi:hypothetical protein